MAISDFTLLLGLLPFRVCITCIWFILQIEHIYTCSIPHGEFEFVRQSKDVLGGVMWISNLKTNQKTPIHWEARESDQTEIGRRNWMPSLDLGPDNGLLLLNSESGFKEDELSDRLAIMPRANAQSKVDWWRLLRGQRYPPFFLSRYFIAIFQTWQ